MAQNRHDDAHESQHRANAHPDNCLTNLFAVVRRNDLLARDVDVYEDEQASDEKVSSDSQAAQNWSQKETAAVPVIDVADEANPDDAIAVDFRNR